MSLREIAELFRMEGSVGEITRYGAGHINDNYRIQVTGTGSPGYLLQRINHEVFRDVDLLMENIRKVTSELSRRGQGEETLRLVPARDGGFCLGNPDAGYWRMFHFIPGSVAYERAEDPELAYWGARMYGRFLTLLSGLAPGSLGETIPRFHDVTWRLEQLEAGIRADAADRLRYVREEVRRVRSKASLLTRIHSLGKEGIIPLRITHNDAKISNVLFDGSRRGLCVVDLDTVMPGYVHYDFGDGIRSFTNTGREDDPDPQSVRVDMELYRAFAEGYLEEAAPLLNRGETESLHFAGILFSYMQGIRFLTDFLNGDTYYRTEYETHNLVRARAQFRLAGELEARQEETRLLIQKIVH